MPASPPKRSPEYDVIVVGAGVGGLSAALRLAGAGARVLVLESHASPGGKMRVLSAGGTPIDAGPTVLTMRSIFERLWEDAGLAFHTQVPTEPLELLARHRWSDQSELDLFLDAQRSYESILAFAGRREADGFVRFHKKAMQIVDAVREPFMLAPDNGILSGLSKTGVAGFARLSKIQWHRSLWAMLGTYFADRRLRQLFARYATYYGSDPFQAPGTLALIAGVELDGVWRVRGGMFQLAQATADAAVALGAQIEYGMEVQSILHDNSSVCGVITQDGRRWNTKNVVYNGGLARLGAKLCRRFQYKAPAQRSLSAVTITGVGQCKGMDLAYHNVCFSADYSAEFESIYAKGQLPTAPTTYICAQDQVQPTGEGCGASSQRIFALLNAPAKGDAPSFGISRDAALDAMNRVMNQCGIQLEFQPSTLTITDPKAFETRFPGTGGALYGPATHGVTGAFARPNCQTKIPGLFLAGGEVHPGAGVPMVTLGGMHCADRVLERLGLTLPSRMAGMRGGTSMWSVRTVNTH